MDEPFKPILDACSLMRGFPAPWFVSGGWAIDLFLDRVTRRHSDIEIGIFRRDQSSLWQHLPDWSFEKCIDSSAGGTWAAWDRSEELRLPVHQIRVTRPRASPPEFEFFLNECAGAHWLSRRHHGLTRPLSQVTMICPPGIPVLVPEIQLLFKAKQTRRKDRADFDAALPRLSRTQREWLATSLCEYHPEHEWITAIEGRHLDEPDRPVPGP
jgi:hypothetical protein